jgi:GTP cyclohydrolase I
MKAYENPVFVEDMVRSVAMELRNDSRCAAGEIEAVNDESIHNHQAFASFTWRADDVAA